VSSAIVLGGAGTETVGGLAVAPGDDVLVSGTTTSAGAGGADLFAVRVAPNGIPHWQLALGSAGTEYQGGIAPDGAGAVVTGGTPTQMMVARVDGTGAVTSVRGFFSSTSNAVGRFAFSAPGGFIFTGNPVSMDPTVLFTRADLTIDCTNPDFAGSLDLTNPNTPTPTAFQPVTLGLIATPGTPVFTNLNLSLTPQTPTMVDQCM
jgi:hypothetical protein